MIITNFGSEAWENQTTGIIHPSLNIEMISFLLFPQALEPIQN